MNQNGKALNASRKLLRGVSVLGTDPLPILVGICLMASSGVVFGVNYAVNGTLTYKVFLPDPENPHTIQSTFRVAVHEDEWFIQLTPMVTNSALAKKCIQVGSDGTNVYEFRFLNPSFDPNSLERKALRQAYDEYRNQLSAQSNSTESSGLEKIAGEVVRDDLIQPQSNANSRKTPWNQATAVVWPGIIPRSGRDPYDVLWLAFASRSYLRGSRDGYLPTVGIPEPKGSRAITPTLFRASISFLQSPLGLPETMQLFSSNDTRVTLGEYKVTGTTNVSGVYFPSGFSYLRFAPPSKKDSGISGKTLAAWQAQVDSVDIGYSEPMLVKTVSTNTVVADYRVTTGTNATPVGYRLAGGAALKSEEDVRQTLEFAKQTKTEKTRQAAVKAPRISGLILTIAVPVNLLVIFLLWKFRAK